MSQSQEELISVDLHFCKESNENAACPYVLRVKGSKMRINTFASLEEVLTHVGIALKNHPLRDTLLYDLERESKAGKAFQETLELDQQQERLLGSMWLAPVKRR